MLALGVQRDARDLSNLLVQVVKLLLVHVVLILLKPHVLSLSLGVPVLFTMCFAVGFHVFEVLFSFVLKAVVDLAGIPNTQAHLRLGHERLRALFY